MRQRGLPGFWLPFWLLALGCLAPPFAYTQQTEPATLTVVAEGMASLGGDLAGAEEEALWDAKRNAVEQAAGVFIKSHTLGSRFTIEQDDIEGRSQGFLRHWEKIPGTRRIETVGAKRVLHIQIQAEVALLPLARRLADVKELYDDLERPRLRVQVKGSGEEAETVRDTFVAALHAQGFEMAESGPSEVVLTLQLALTPTVRMGSDKTPFGVGEMVASCRSRLTLQAVNPASEDVLFTAQADASGQSFQNDADAARDAARNSVDALLTREQAAFVQTLLAQWARERQEGHTVVIQARGLDARQIDALQALLEEMRGFRHLREVTKQPQGRALYTVTFRLDTRLDTASLRRRLAVLALPEQTFLTVADHQRGPRIVCAARRP